MDEEKVQEEHLHKTGNGSVDSTPRPESETNPADQSSSGDDTFLSPDSSSGRKKVENITPITDSSPSVDKDGSNKKIEKYDSQVGHIDTAAPFESVKEAVSKFGGIADWKAHRAQTNERRKFIEQELEKAQEEIPMFKEKSEAAEREKEQALRDLDSTKRLIEELKLNLERAQTEERQAKQDSELAQLRVHEMEQGVTEESSVAAKTQLEVAKARHQAAASELVAVKDELEDIRRDYAVLVSERDAAIQKAQEAVSAAKEIEREVESLTIQLITTKESIESTHAAHLEAEELRIAESTARDQDTIIYEKELQQSEEELEKVKQQLILAKDLKSKLETASVLLHKLKDELAIYMQGKMPEESEADDKFTRKDIQSGVAVAKKNLEEVNNDIGKTQEQIMRLKTAANSLTANLESEKATLTKIRKQKGLGEKAVVSLESELKRTQTELDDIRRQEKEAREKLAELPKRLQKVSEETEKAKSMAEGARLVLKKAKEAAEQATSGVSSISTRVAAAQKEIEAARAAEKLALGAITALHESESAKGPKDPKGGVTISLEEYYELTKKGHEAEEEANKRVEDAMAQIDAAKDAEMQSLNKLTQINSQLAAQKEALNAALQRAEMAKESTLNVEEELKKHKGESDPKRKGSGGLFRGSSTKANNDSQPSSPPSLKSRSGKKSGGTPEGNSNAGEQSPEVKGSKKKKNKSFMPKFFMFLGKKKQFPHKNS